jgi:hypothetical protein
MKLLATVFGILLLLAEATPPQAAIPYFSNYADVTVAKPDQTAYVVVPLQSGFMRGRS